MTKTERISAEVQRLLDDLWDEMDRKDMTVREMAEKTGITARGIYAWRWQKRDRSPNLYNMVDCAMALGLRLKFVRCGKNG